MNNKLKEIALRVKELREIKGYTTAEMASFADVTESTYLSFEAGESDFGFTFIHTVSSSYTNRKSFFV